MEFTDTEPSITDDDLATFEASVGITLPSDYREHIVRFNGGLPAASYYLYEDEEYYVASFHPINHGDFTVNDLLDALRGLPEDVFPAHLYPFADDAFGNSYCLDLANGGVVFWSQDTDEGPVSLATTFTEFVDGLTEEGEGYEF